MITCFYKGVVYTMLILPKCLCYFLLYFPESFGRGEELERSGSIGCMEKVICLVSLFVKNSRTELVRMARKVLVPLLSCVTAAVLIGVACVQHSRNSHMFVIFLFFLLPPALPCLCPVTPACLLHTAPTRSLS
ncbi:hypothetical protein HJG60_008270 [Phyllostomus discolor]|uniref:Uncharacterized protein n=1 Tax=Phyllostomus discolor TaxID=89673 RepID=A0A833ZB34_9CHIR|nr:hypothetical protein HJG60_008270 [Phyllostomus discolor]